MTTVEVNLQQRLYVIPAGEGYTTAGFDYVFKQLSVLAEKLAGFGVSFDPVREDEIGTAAQYEQYRAAWRLVGNRDLGTWFDSATPAKVRRILESYRRSGEVLRVFYGDTKTGRDWMEEFDTIGQVGRSTGPMKVPLLIANGDCGGGCILDHCIVRLMDVETGQEIYRHPSYHQGDMEIRKTDSVRPYEVFLDGNVHAGFRTYGDAAHWVAFMTGNCQEPPAN